MRSSTFLALFAGAALPALAGENQPGARQANSSFVELKKSFEEASKAYSEEWRAAYAVAKKKGDEAARSFKFEKPGPGPAFSPRFLAVAENDPKGPEALEALKLAIQTSSDENGKAIPTRLKAIKLLHEHHVASAGLDKRFLGLLAWISEKEVRAFLDDVAARNPDRTTQARAVQALANAFDRRAELARYLVDDSQYRARVEKELGAAEVSRQIAQRGAAQNEAEKLRAVLRARYSDLVPDLSIGQPAPPVVAESLDGKTATLADLKGRVVVIDVWATWCGPCKAMIPHERTMVERLKSKPFTLVSISADEKKETLENFLAKEPMPWTHWWSGPEGKSMELLNIQHYPTIYVLDAKGVIRYTEIRGEELEKAVNTLLQEVNTR